MIRRIAQFLHALDRDDRGNLGILLLMTIWALVALVGLIWNNGEYATRRTHVQTAADATAHSAATWTSRSNNAITATNILLAQTVVAEGIFNAVDPTQRDVAGRLTREENAAQKLLERAAYFEDVLSIGPKRGNGRGETLSQTLATLNRDIRAAIPALPMANKARYLQQLTEAVRQNNVAIAYLLNVWIGGQQPAANQPGPPPLGATMNPAGLGPIVEPWLENEAKPRLQAILATLPSEWDCHRAFIEQAGSADITNLPTYRRELYDYQGRVVQLTPQVIEEQRAKLREFYRCESTHATPRNDAPNPDGSSAVTAPLNSAETPEARNHPDTVRGYAVALDPVNANTDRLSIDNIDALHFAEDNSAIWHGPVTEERTVDLGPVSTTVRHTFGDHYFGQVPCAPLTRYAFERSYRDREGLGIHMRNLDQIRSILGGQIYPPPPEPYQPIRDSLGNGVFQLPGTIADPANPSRIIGLPPMAIPRIQLNGPAPAGINVNALNQRISQYNNDIQTWVRDIRRCPDDMERYYIAPMPMWDDEGRGHTISSVEGLCYIATLPFAWEHWCHWVATHVYNALLKIGQDKQFMVLKSYALYEIPDWAIDDMRNSAYDYVYHFIYDRAIASVTHSVRWNFYHALIRARVAHGQAMQIANSRASPVARDICDSAANIFATACSEEWVLRPWPYEFTPPDDAVPPTRGLGKDDRLKYFTLLTAAQTSDDTRPRVFFEKMFRKDTHPMTAYAQAETFNWMEFNQPYGTRDSYNAVTHYGYGVVAGDPTPWRLSTVGGWNWNPRLSFSDGLAEAMANNPEFKQFFEEGGVTGYDVDAVQTVTMH